MNHNEPNNLQCIQGDRHVFQSFDNYCRCGRVLRDRTLFECHHCKRNEEQGCTCSVEWAQYQLELGLTPLVRVYDHGWLVTR